MNLNLGSEAGHRSYGASCTDGGQKGQQSTNQRSGNSTNETCTHYDTGMERPGAAKQRGHQQPPHHLFLQYTGFLSTGDHTSHGPATPRGCIVHQDVWTCTRNSDPREPLQDIPHATPHAPHAILVPTSYPCDYPRCTDNSSCTSQQLLEPKHQATITLAVKSHDQKS